MQSKPLVLVAVLCLLAAGSPTPSLALDKTIEELIEDLRHPSADTRYRAAWELWERDREAAPAVPALIGALRDETEDVQYAAIRALRDIGPMAAHQAAPALVEVFVRGRIGVRGDAFQAAMTLGIGPEAAAAVPSLVEILRGEDPWRRSQAAEVLGEIGPAATAAVPALSQAVQDRDETVRMHAASALGKIGVPVRSVVIALASVLENQDEAVEAAAHFAFEEIVSSEQIVLGEQDQAVFPWWVIPCVYWKELVGLLALLVAWFLLAARFPRHRPRSPAKQAAVFALAGAVPTSLSCWAVHVAVTRPWAQYFLPEAFLTILPFRISAILSVGFVCVLLAVWACWRKPASGETAD